MGPRPIPRVCGLAYYLLTVSLYSSWHCRLHSCPTWVNNLAEISRHQGRVFKTCCETWFRNTVCYWVKSFLTQILSPRLLWYIGWRNMSTTYHAGVRSCQCHVSLEDWLCHRDRESRRIQSRKTQLKHDHAWSHDTQPCNPVVLSQVGYGLV